MRPSNGWLVVVLLACTAATALAGRDAEVAQFVDKDGKISDDTLRAKFKELVLKNILNKEIIDDPGYNQMSVNLMEGITRDLDAFKKIKEPSGREVDFPVPTTRVPAFIPGQTVQFGKTCGRVARLWVRMPFHDCGTYNRKKNLYGCDGSLRLEIPAGFGFPPFGNDKELQADSPGSFPFNAKDHPENAGFAPSVDFFEGARKDEKGNYLTYKGKPISWADSEVLGGILALWICGGGFAKFRHGRVDVNVANPSGLLPSPLDTQKQNIKAFNRMGLTKKDLVILGGGSHSIQAFLRGSGDKTPSDLDNLWAKEARDIAKKRPTAPPVCNAVDAANFDPKVAVPASKDHCALPFVPDLYQGATAKFIDEVADKPSSYFSEEFTRAYERMCNLFPGFQTKNDGAYDGESADVEETPREREDRKKNWYKFAAARRMAA